MANKTQTQAPVTYHDQHYVARTIRVGRDELRVANSRITVTDPAHIKALDKLHGLVREGK